MVMNKAESELVRMPPSSKETLENVPHSVRHVPSRPLDRTASAWTPVVARAVSKRPTGWLMGRPQGTPEREPDPLFEISLWSVYGVDLLRYAVTILAVFVPYGFALYASQKSHSPSAVSTYVPSWIGLLVIQWELNVIRLPEVTRRVTKPYLDVSRVRVMYALIIAVVTAGVLAVGALGEAVHLKARWVDGDLLKGLATLTGFAGVVALRGSHAADREYAVAYAVSENARVASVSEWSSERGRERNTRPRLYLMVTLAASIFLILVQIAGSKGKSPEPLHASQQDGGTGLLWLIVVVAAVCLYLIRTAPGLFTRFGRWERDISARRKAAVCREKHSPNCPGHLTRAAKVGTYEI